MGKSLPVVAVLLALTVAGAGAVTLVVTDTATGEGTVTQGMEYRDLTAGGSATVASGGTNWSIDVASGGQFSIGYVKENLANEKTEPLVETIVLDGGDTSLTASMFENVTFEAYTPSESNVTHLDSSNPLVEYVEYDDSGAQAHGSGNTYLRTVEVDSDGDSETELLVCVGDEHGGDNVATPDSRDGMAFAGEEIWDGTFEFDTSSYMPSDTQLDLTMQLNTLFDGQGGVNPMVTQCPQYGG